jgi:hypothetical protein
LKIWVKPFETADHSVVLGHRLLTSGHCVA